MRIAYLGAQTSVHTRRWVSFFAERGHDVHLLSCGVGDHPADGYVVHDLGAPKFGKVGYLGCLPAARRILRSLRPDVVHAHYATSYGAIALTADVRPLIVTAHGDDVLVLTNPARRRVVREVLRRADLVTVPSDHMREAVTQLTRGAGAPVLVFQYGVETARLAQLADRYRSTDEASVASPLRIVSARPLMPPYRVELLIEALAILRQRRVPFVCEIVGDGPHRRRLTEAADRAGLGGVVHFLGTVPSAVVEERLARADISVSLSRRDGASLAVLEALAIGTAAVLSDIPANRPWASPEGAVLVGSRPADVADGIEQAGALDREAALKHNRTVALERADLATNLGRFESVMEALVLGNSLTMADD